MSGHRHKPRLPKGWGAVRATFRIVKWVLIIVVVALVVALVPVGLLAPGSPSITRTVSHISGTQYRVTITVSNGGWGYLYGGTLYDAVPFGAISGQYTSVPVQTNIAAENQVRSYYSSTDTVLKWDLGTLWPTWCGWGNSFSVSYTLTVGPEGSILKSAVVFAGSGLWGDKTAATELVEVGTTHSGLG